MPSINSPAQPGPSQAQARGRARARPGPRGPGLGPGVGLAGLLIDGIDVNPPLIDINLALKYLESKNRTTLLVKKDSGNEYVRKCIIGRWQW